MSTHIYTFFRTFIVHFYAEFASMGCRNYTIVECFFIVILIMNISGSDKLIKIFTIKNVIFTPIELTSVFRVFYIYFVITVEYLVFVIWFIQTIIFDIIVGIIAISSIFIFIIFSLLILLNFITEFQPTCE